MHCMQIITGISRRIIGNNTTTARLLPSSLPPCGDLFGARPLFRRNLILQTSPPDPLRIEKLSDSDSGIVELKLERAKAKNAINKDMLRRLRDALEGLDRDSSANVVLISSSVPGVFCAGADLKERRLMSATEVRQFVNSLRSTFSLLETYISRYFLFPQLLSLKGQHWVVA